MTGHSFPWPGPGGAGAQGGPGSALLQVLTSRQSPSSAPPPHCSESLSLCSRRVSDTLSHYPPEGGGEPGTLQPNYSRACQRRGRGRYQRREREGASRKSSFLSCIPPPPQEAQWCVHNLPLSMPPRGSVPEKWEEPCGFVCRVGGRRMGRWKLAWQWGEVVRTRLLGP